MRKAAQAAGGDVAPWLRHLLRAITATDFPASWRAGEALRRGIPESCSHDSQAYGKRFMLRLHETTWETLERLSRHFDKSSAEIIRQLIAQVTLEDFPESWQLAAEHRPRPARAPEPVQE